MWDSFVPEAKVDWEKLCHGLTPLCLRMMDPDAQVKDCPYHQDFQKAMRLVKAKFRDRYQDSAGTGYFRNLLSAYCVNNPGACTDIKGAFPEVASIHNKLWDPNRPPEEKVSRTTRPIPLVAFLWGMVGVGAGASTAGTIGAGVTAVAAGTGLGIGIYNQATQSQLWDEAKRISADLLVLRNGLAEVNETLNLLTQYTTTNFR